MKLANYEDSPFLVVPDGGIDVPRASSARWQTMADVYDDWQAFTEWADTAHVQPTRPLVPERLGPPSPQPRQVFAIGLNYATHAAESGTPPPAIPPTFTKYLSSLTGPYGPIVLPSNTVDWEVELVVVIGKTCVSVTATDAWSHVAGVTVGQDLSDRVVQLQPPAPQFSLGKSFPGFGPTGPHLVTVDEFDDPDDLGLQCELNGEIMQRGRTSGMIFSVPRLIEHLSSIITLLPGDLIFTGTPDGVGGSRTPPKFLQDGDVLVTSIDGVGEMRHRLVAASSGAADAG